MQIRGIPRNFIVDSCEWSRSQTRIAYVLSAERPCSIHRTSMLCPGNVCAVSAENQSITCNLPRQWFVDPVNSSLHTRGLAHRETHPMILDANCSHRVRLLRMPISLANSRRIDRKSPSDTQLNCIDKHCTSLNQNWTSIKQTLRLELISYSRQLRKHGASRFLTVQIRKFFSAILRMLCEVSPNSAKRPRMLHWRLHSILCWTSGLDC